MTTQFECVSMSSNALTKDVLAEIERKGLRPARCEDLFAFSKEHPDAWRESPIAAFGPKPGACGDHNVALLWGIDDHRYFYEFLIGDVWTGVNCRFLAVRQCH